MSSKIVISLSSLILVLAGCSSGSTGTNTTGTGAGGLGGLLGGTGAKDGGTATGSPFGGAQMSGTPSAPSTPTAPTKGGTCQLTKVTLSDNACGSCQAQSCCSQWKACDANQECLQLVSCVAQCSGASQDECQNQCAQDFPDKSIQQLVINLGQCIQTNCDAACN